MKTFVLGLSTTLLFSDYTEEVMDRYRRDDQPVELVECEEINDCESRALYTGPYTSCGCNMLVTADFLFWTPRISNIAFTATNECCYFDKEVLDVKTGEVLEPDWSYEPGFRAGFGWYFGCEGWRILAEYTWLRFENRTVKPKLKSDVEIIPSLGNPFFKTETSKGNLKFGFNVVDIEFGKTFCVDPSLLLDAHFGLKAQYQSYKFHLKETGLSWHNKSDATSKELFFNKTWGIGIRTGVAPRWNWCDCLSLFSEIAVTAQWQHFESKGVVFLQEDSSGLFSSFLDVKNLLFLVTPILETEIGLRWENWCCSDCFHFVTKLGWELQWWGKQNQFISYFTETRDGDLGLQGLTFSVEFDF